MDPTICLRMENPFKAVQLQIRELAGIANYHTQAVYDIARGGRVGTPDERLSC